YYLTSIVGAVWKLSVGGLCQGKQGMITVSGGTVLAPPVCCPWRNRASGIPRLKLIKANLA
ncbi:MAG: hypothetical protein V3R96_05220, partial [Dehalococcoidales bacterium]